jgi:hypothetical protein
MQDDGAMKKFLEEGEARKDYHERKRRGELNRPPLRTFIELCDELGVTQGQMRAFFRKYKDHPAAQFYKYGVNRKTYYNPIEFRAWWKKIQENK